jgi:hypothetical protein
LGHIGYTQVVKSFPSRTAEISLAALSQGKED